MRSVGRWVMAAVLALVPVVAILPITIAGNEQADGGCIGCGLLDLIALTGGFFLARVWLRRTAK